MRAVLLAALVVGCKSAETAPADAGTAAKAPPHPSPAEVAAWVKKLDLGRPGELFPAALQGVRLGMTTAELRAARPRARIGEKPVKLRLTGGKEAVVALEPAEGDGAFESFRYVFESDKLRFCLAKLRFVVLPPSLLEKTKAKWGAARMSGYRDGVRWRWRLPIGQVDLDVSDTFRRARFVFGTALPD
jgi:hypothetical protein